MISTLKTEINRKSLITSVIIVIIILISHFSLPYYKEYFFTKEISWDIISYYLYLPMTFIYYDPGISDLSVIHHIIEKYQNTNTFYQAFPIENGNYVLNYMNGFAIFFLPFFFIGHMWALIGGFDADGFSFPYQFAISNGVYIYIIAGIFSLRKLLLNYFDDITTSLVLIFLLLGTNYFNETVRANLMPHAIMFAMVTFFVRLTIAWHEKPTLKNSILFGSIAVLMVLARPSEILLLIFPILYKVTNKESFVRKMNFYFQNLKFLIIAIISAFIVCIPQLLYWKVVTGNFVFFSYQNTEGFNFLEPHLLESLFSFKNSWLIYTPLIIFPLLGLFMLYHRNRDLFVPIFIFTIINFYILSSWLAWWNGGGMGMRYFVESYVLLSIPFGYFISWLSTKSVIQKIVIFTFLISFLFINLFQTWQAANYIMPHDQRNFAFYKANFFATNIKPENTRLLDIERSYGSTEKLKNEGDYNKKTLAFYNFEEVNTGSYNEEYKDSSFSFSKPFSMRLDENNAYSPGVKIPFREVTTKDHFWVRFTVKFYPLTDLKSNQVNLIVTMDYISRNFYYRSFDLSDFTYELNKWNSVTVEYLTPYPFSYKNERLVAYVWLQGKEKIFIDDINIEAFERKW